MRFLVDEDVYRDTICFLRELGHDLVLAADLGMSRAPDERLLETALEQERILITRDKDFGHGSLRLKVPLQLNERKPRKRA